MAVLEGVGKVLGKATQAVGDAVQNAGDSLKKGWQESQEKKEEAQKKEAEMKAAKANKCPKCGNDISGISAVCPLCGYEIKIAKPSTAVSELLKEIDKLEKKRNVVGDAIAVKFTKSDSKPTDDKIASLIRNFVVPNTKQDIFEFMIQASMNVDAKVMAGKKQAEDVAEVIIKAWESKFQQTYQKAKVSFGEDMDFKKIQSIYDAKMKEIEEAKKFSLFRRK